MHFANGPELAAMLEPQLRAITKGIARRSLESHPQTGLPAQVSEEAGFRRVLRHEQINAPIAIKIRNRCASLLSIDQHSALLPQYGAQPTLSISSQPQPAARVAPGGLGTFRKKVLA